MQKIDEILYDPAFDCFDSQMKAAVKQMYTEMQGKPPETAVLILQKYYPKIFAGKKITPGQRDAMLRVLTADMNDSDKRKLNTILKLLKL